MPTVQSPSVLSAVYTATLSNVKSALTTIIGADATFFRAFDQAHFTVDTYRHILRRDQAANALMVPDFSRNENADHNRFTGDSHNSSIPSWGGVYCSLQQQALVNEVTFDVETARAKAAAARGTVPTTLPRSDWGTGSWVFNSKAVIKIRALGPVVAVDLSPHNTYSIKFLDLIALDSGVKKALTAAGKGGGRIGKE